MHVEDDELLTLLGGGADDGILSEEIAAILGISQNTAWKRLRKLIAEGEVKRVWVSRENPWSPGSKRMMPGYARAK